MTQRNTELEERILFVENDLEELSRMVAQQGLLLERIEAELRELRRLATPAAPDAGPARTLEDDRPPHY